MSILKRLVPLLLAVVLLAGCGQNGSTPNAGDTGMDEENMYVDAVELSEDSIEEEIADEAVALASSPVAVAKVLKPVASGKKVEKNTKATIDYSNAKDGYVMVKFTATTQKRLKVLVKGPSGTQYQYNLPPREWTTFPFSDGNGKYTVSVYENTTGSKYAKVLSLSLNVTLTDEFAPFIRPNQYVDYENATNTISMAQKLAGKEKDPMKKVEKIYDYVVKNFTYDTAKASTVKSGYLPDLDAVLKSKKGICFDYAAVMVGMLRSQGVPCKLVVGNAGDVYHAWINVWSEKNGWIDGAIRFNGKKWERMDPTFASTANSSKKIMQYIGDGSNYDPKLIY